MTDTVKLNVGGTIFQTTHHTLTKLDGFFRRMLESRIPVPKDDSDAIFIDRDPTHFRLILNFMRDGHVDLQKYSEDVEEIQKEAEYYCLEGLMELCKNQKPEELEYPNKFRYIESDKELLNLTYKPEKPVLVLFGSIDSHGRIAYPEHENLIEFQRKYASEINVYIRLSKTPGYKSEFDFNSNWNYMGYTKKRVIRSERYFDFSRGMQDRNERILGELELLMQDIMSQQNQ